VPLFQETTVQYPRIELVIVPVLEDNSFVSYIFERTEVKVNSKITTNPIIKGFSASLSAILVEVAITIPKHFFLHCITS
jgi:hypothetical protein